MLNPRICPRIPRQTIISAVVIRTPPPRLRGARGVAGAAVIREIMPKVREKNYLCGLRKNFPYQCGGIQQALRQLLAVCADALVAPPDDGGRPAAQ
eukprot:3880216-Pyramimonas_sp.AAC.1